MAEVELYDVWWSNAAYGIDPGEEPFRDSADPGVTLEGARDWMRRCINAQGSLKRLDPLLARVLLERINLLQPWEKLPMLDYLLWFGPANAGAKLTGEGDLTETSDCV